jgi:general secretion pathway protein L
VKNDFFNSLMSRLGGMDSPSRPQAWQSATMTLELLLPESWPVSNHSISWCLRKHGSIVDQGETRNLSDLKDKSKDAFVLAWVPTRDVLLTRLSMPTRSKRRIEQALPYALEEILLNDPDTQHYTYTRATDNDLAVAIVARETIADWINELNESGLPVRALLPTLLGLPYSVQTATLVQEDNQLCLRTGNYSGLSLAVQPDSHPPELLKPILDEARSNDNLTSIDIYNMDDSTNWDDWHKLLALEIRSGQQPLFSLLNPVSCPLNLMHGEYTIQIQKKKQPLNQLKLAAIMATVGLFLLLTQHLIDAWQLSTTNETLQKEMVSLFRKTFPKVPVRDPVAAQMNQKYNELIGGSSAGGAFMNLLSSTTSLLQNTGNYSLTTINYNDKKLTLNINLKDYAALDQIKGKAADYGLKVEVLSANRRENLIAGRIRITGS